MKCPTCGHLTRMDAPMIPGERSAERGQAKSPDIESGNPGFDTRRRGGAPGTYADGAQPVAEQFDTYVPWMAVWQASDIAVGPQASVFHADVVRSPLAPVAEYEYVVEMRLGPVEVRG